jgi:hypothetical protein
LKKIIYVKLKLIDKIKNKYNFDKRAKNKKKKLKLKHQQQRGQPVIFRGEERKQEEKKYIGDKPLHYHRHTPHHKEDGMLTLLMT